MLIFLSDGRLGNQLFQYSFLNTIAKEDEKILTVNMEQFVGKFDINNTKFQHFVLGKYGKFFIRKFVKPLVIFALGTSLRTLPIKLIPETSSNKLKASLRFSLYTTLLLMVDFCGVAERSWSLPAAK